MSLERQWKLSQRKPVCSHDGQPFQVGAPFYTAIFWDDQVGEFRREDYSEESWKAIREQASPFSFWRSIYENLDDDGKKSEAVGKEDAESTLRRLLEENEPGTERTRYFLALLLERKKILQQIDSQEQDGRRFIIFRRRRTEEVFIIPDPNLSLEELPAVQEEVMALLPTN